jgi:AraC-like DNA-binding protein
VTTRSAAAQQLRDLVLLRRVRDRIDREFAQLLDVEALARGVHLSAGHLSRQFRLSFSTRFTELVGVPPSVFRRQAAQTTAGMSSCGQAGDPTGQESRSTAPRTAASMNAVDGLLPRHLRLRGQQQASDDSPICRRTTRSLEWHA